jgi:hypothetical protein
MYVQRVVFDSHPLPWKHVVLACWHRRQICVWNCVFWRVKMYRNSLFWGISSSLPVTDIHARACLVCEWHYIRGKARDLPAFHQGGPGSTPGQSMWICGEQSGTGTGFSPECFGFSLSVSFHLCSIAWKNEKRWSCFSSSASQRCTVSLKAAVRP